MDAAQAEQREAPHLTSPSLIAYEYAHGNRM